MQIGGGPLVAPSSKWWVPFVELQEKRRRRPVREFGAPRLGLDVHDLDETSGVRRAYRQWVGRYRVCHEYALARVQSATSPEARRVEGYWVARVAHGSGGRICAAQVLETTLPAELSACLRREVLAQPPVGGEPGRLEVVVTFHEP